MTRANLVIFLATALVLCVLLGLKASLRRVAHAPAPAATESHVITVVPVKPDSTQIPAPAVSVPLATEPRAITVVPVKPAPVTDARQISTIRIAPDAKAAGPGTPGGRGPDGQ